MKVAVCCIIKEENDYLKEFVEYYKNLGIDNIIIYDNNDSDGEDINDSIKEYIDTGYVIVVEDKDKEAQQRFAYNDCIAKYGREYDWICFFDVDEYLILQKHDNIKDYLAGFPETCDCIHINWRCMSDNNLLYNDGRPLIERFTEAIDKNESINNHIKSIVKVTKMNNPYYGNPHYFAGCNECRLNNGNLCSSYDSFNVPVNWDDACLTHFVMKTITEFLYKKMKRGTADRTLSNYRNVVSADSFFSINKRTPEKEQIITEFINNQKL